MTQLSEHQTRRLSSWIIDKSFSMGFSSRDTAMSISLCYRFLHKEKINPRSFHRLACACMLVADKYDNDDPLTSLDRLSEATDGNVSPLQIERQERELLRVLEWKISQSLPVDYLSEYYGRTSDAYVVSVFLIDVLSCTPHALDYSPRQVAFALSHVINELIGCGSVRTRLNRHDELVSLLKGMRCASEIVLDKHSGALSLMGKEDLKKWIWPLSE